MSYDSNESAITVSRQKTVSYLQNLCKFYLYDLYFHTAAPSRKYYVQSLDLLINLHTLEAREHLLIQCKLIDSDVDTRTTKLLWHLQTSVKMAGSELTDWRGGRVSVGLDPGSILSRVAVRCGLKQAPGVMIRN